MLISYIFFSAFVGGINELSVVFIRIIRESVCSFNENGRIGMSSSVL